MNATGAPVTLSDEYQGRAGAILGRLQGLYPKLIDLSLDRLHGLLARLGHPERALPPVVHVAGTNGKGSTCANLRAIAEAAGWRVHVMTSPHLIDVTERFRLAGKLVSEDALVAALEEVERVNGDAPITVFEVLTAAGFLLFSRTPADLAIIEVGLGGRLDATNVIDRPAACAITAISLDHQAFLGDTLDAIAAEKAGIMKPGVPVVCAPQRPEALAVLRARAAAVGAPLWVLGEDVRISGASALAYSDPLGELSLPAPALRGPHQHDNAALAVAALRASRLPLPDRAWAGIAAARWPARMQRLTGALAARLPDGWELWLDGGHNPGAGDVLAAVLADWRDRPVHLVVGMKQSKDVRGFLDPLLSGATTAQAVAEPGQHLALGVDEIVAASGGRAVPGPTVGAALARLRAAGGPPARVLICGSLYLAGLVLAQDGAVLD
ncbi:bifunctional protein FolC [Neoasaia chiangmaiensis NBRC 101099]|uniref:tetrahydrofolate synthase n=1 Tax=Neoasaia chiangmaiensis TaxID=320497 RepID=A0A1U9KQK2_9PROT|nr:folylpolyglutamate synthase/dihydrofolate synthase family protein [Neoasaia chiangmaiensis]AQS88002.1 bifunctional folylpolyglutamate synthase/dihydrofolate synthase [Neoasaia chiangmaiensis]GBR38879.1 bifunctional protein FolC [Neoasaia chiangmaiensis NBRC 101099]GEN15668.1 bifunctional folylpolyglutamate synthase/dihydrofolate synthase [Neoasaia chiangmaiensis]